MIEKRLVFATRRIPDAGLDLLKRRPDVRLVIHPKDSAISPKALLAGVKGATGILSLLTERVDATVMDAAGPALKVIANYAVGFDNIDIDEAAKRGIAVANTPGVLTEAVAEHAFALMLAAARRIVESDAYMRTGKYKAWAPLLLIGQQLYGKTLGVIGLGRIGFGVAERAGRGMGMNVLYHDLQRDEKFESEFGAAYAPLDELLKTADVVSIHVPLLPTTRHLIDAKKLALMKPTAILVNTSRGPIIDEKALVAALKRKRLFAAGLDVFEHEPTLSPGLKALPNVVLTPHTASATVEARNEMAVLAAQAICDVLDGKTPKNAIKRNE